MEYLKTFKEMFSHPENVVDNFVLKEKTKFQHPFVFGMTGVIIIILLNSILVDFSTELQPGLMAAEGDQMGQLNYWIEYTQLKVSTQFLPLSMFLLFIPSLSLPGLFFFRDDIEGFYYNLILNSYAVGAAILAVLFLIPVWMIDKYSMFDPVLRNYLPVLLTGVLIVFVYKQYFLIRNITGWIRIVSSYIVGCMIFFLLKNFSAGILGYFIFAVDRFLDIWMKA